MEDLPSNKRTSWIKLTLVSILAIAVASMTIIGFKNIDDKTISLNPDSSYVYSVSHPTQMVFVVDEKQIGGVVEESNGILGDMILPAWDIWSPLDKFRKTQGYWYAHKAIDITTDTGSWEIKSVDDGVISYVGWLKGYGWRIEINHQNGFVSTYSHLQKYNVGLGTTIFSGETIGIMGATGGDYGTHLHFEIIYKGIKIDPEKYLKIN